MLSPREYRLYTANQKLITLFLGYSKIIFFSRWFVRIVSEFSFEFGEPESNANQFQPREKGRGKPSKIMKFWALLQADRNGGAIQIQIWPRTCQYTLQELLGNIPLGWNGFVDFFPRFKNRKKTFNFALLGSQNHYHNHDHHHFQRGHGEGARPIQMHWHSLENKWVLWFSLLDFSMAKKLHFKASRDPWNGKKKNCRNNR